MGSRKTIFFQLFLAMGVIIGFFLFNYFSSNSVSWYGLIGMLLGVVILAPLLFSYIRKK